MELPWESINPLPLRMPGGIAHNASVSSGIICSPPDIHNNNDPQATISNIFLVKEHIHSIILYP